jgi:hypothetical protein
MCILAPQVYEDPLLHRRFDRTNIPIQFRHNKDILGVYIYLNESANTTDNPWNTIAKEFFKECTNYDVDGRGSLRIACAFIQKNWTKFENWVQDKYPPL